MPTSGESLGRKRGVVYFSVLFSIEEKRGQISPRGKKRASRWGVGPIAHLYQRGGKKEDDINLIFSQILERQV